MVYKSSEYFVNFEVLHYVDLREPRSIMEIYDM